MGEPNNTVIIRVTGTPLPLPVSARMDSVAGNFPTVIHHLISRDIGGERKAVTSMCGVARNTEPLSHDERPDA